MITDEIRQRYRGEFRPYVVQTSDGRKFRAPRMGCMIVSEHFIAAYDKRGNFVRVDAADIVSVKDLPRPRRPRKRAA